MHIHIKNGFHHKISFFYQQICFHQETHFNQKHVFTTKISQKNCKIFKCWIEKNIFSDVSQKNSFFEPNLIQKPYKKKKFHPNFFFEWFFRIKFLRMGFWEHIVRYQRTLMFPIVCFFSILNYLFAMNLNPVICFLFCI